MPHHNNDRRVFYVTRAGSVTSDLYRSAAVAQFETEPTLTFLPKPPRFFPSSGTPSCQVSA